MSQADFEKAHTHTFCNYHEILKSEVAGCFYCLRIFQAILGSGFIPTECELEWCFEIITEENGEQTMVCSCWVDAVIESASRLPITTEFLLQMHNYWFKKNES